MTTQPTGPMLPGVAGAAAGVTRDEEESRAAEEARATDEGVPVGDADARADAERSGASVDDDVMGSAADAVTPDVDQPTRTDQGVPVGEADVDADRRRTGADDTGA